MPKPRVGEDREGYVGRCIPQVLADGSAKDQQQAAAMCYSMYDMHRKNVLTRFVRFLLRKKDNATKVQNRS